MSDATGAPAPDLDTTATTDTGAPAAPVAVSGGDPGGTLLTAEVAEKAVAAPADWPQDWRAKVAGEDAKELARLQRMGSPADLWKSYRALEAKLADKSGKPALAPPEGATPEQAAAWRKEMGLPEKPEAYTPALGNGLVVGEEDKPLLEGFKQAAYDANMTPDQFNKALNWYYTQLDQTRTQQSENDALHRREAEDALRAEWGAEYRGNVTAIKNIGDMFPDGSFDRLISGRTADGKLIGDDPAILRGLAMLAREFNPAAPHIPVGSSNPMQGISSRISEIQQIMRTDPSAYWANQKMQDEFRDLLAAQEKMQGRSAA